MCITNTTNATTTKVPFAFCKGDLCVKINPNLFIKYDTIYFSKGTFVVDVNTYFCYNIDTFIDLSMPQLSKFKFFLIVLALIVGATALIGIPVFLSIQKENKINNERIEAKKQEMQKNNPALYDALANSIGELIKKTQEEPANQQPWIELGVSYQNLGDYINAKKAYKQAIEISDQTLAAWNNLFEIYKDEGNYKEAKKTALNWIVATKEPTAYLKLAEMYVAGMGGNMLDAFDILRKGIDETKSQSLQDAFKRLESTGSL